MMSIKFEGKSPEELEATSTEKYSISSSEATYIFFCGEQIGVTVTKKDATVVNEWILQTVHIHRGGLVGLDIECFNPEEHHPVALLQLCVGRRCLLFQLLHKDAVPLFLVRSGLKETRRNCFVITGCSGLALSVYWRCLGK
ncbi:putative 21 kDa protein-like [Capsicum annuum]|nr:putative 21 kDa protein-like [Capsicum annuum]